MFKLFKVILKRMLALIILKVTGVLAAGSIAGIELWQSAAVAAFVAVMETLSALAAAYVADGQIDTGEIDTAFKKYGADNGQ
jgi:hypothetical protein